MVFSKSLKHVLVNSDMSCDTKAGIWYHNLHYVPWTVNIFRHGITHFRAIMNHTIWFISNWYLWVYVLIPNTIAINSCGIFTMNPKCVCMYVTFLNPLVMKFQQCLQIKNNHKLMLKNFNQSKNSYCANSTRNFLKTISHDCIFPFNLHTSGSFMKIYDQYIGKKCTFFGRMKHIASLDSKLNSLYIVLYLRIQVVYSIFRK